MGLQQVFMGNMRKYRKQAGITQEKLAELCDCDSSYIRQIETGKRFPSVRYIERIAGAVGVAPHLLFYEETAPANPRRLLHALLTEKVNACIDEALSGWYGEERPI
jgi:transcriptional regulator with XRE-family HTH domain